MPAMWTDLEAMLISWNLMIGRNPLLVAKEHGHRIITMLTVYAAWTEGAVEADIVAIRGAMNRTRSRVRRARKIIETSPRVEPALPARTKPPSGRGDVPIPTATGVFEEMSSTEWDGPDAFGSGLASTGPPPWAKDLKGLKKTGGEDGTRTASA
jgi:hypothetical protein